MWDARTNSLCWVDITNGIAHQRDHATGSIQTAEIAPLASSVLIPTKAGHLYASHLGLIYREGSEQRLLTNPEPNLPTNRLNDCKVGPGGALWAGTMNIGRKGPTGALYRYGPEGVTQVLSGMTTTNGLDWSPDGTTFYLIDTFPRLLYAFDHDPETGALSNRRVLRDFSKQEGVPDGMCTDADGNLWIAFWGGWRVGCYAPDGTLVTQINMPVAQPTSCCFGGENLDQLFITSAAIGIDEEGFEQAPLSGGVFTVTPGVRGLPTRTALYPEI